MVGLLMTVAVVMVITISHRRVGRHIRVISDMLTGLTVAGLLVNMCIHGAHLGNRCTRLTFLFFLDLVHSDRRLAPAALWLHSGFSLRI